jgi:RNA polymerase sigma-70 factor, ECF subfamily
MQNPSGAPKSSLLVTDGVESGLRHTAPQDPALAANNDEALILAVRRGDRGAPGALYQRLIPTIRRTLWRILDSGSADRDDLVQVSFERIMNTVVDGTYRGDCGLRRWAASIATCAAIDHHRARCRERRFIETEERVNQAEASVPAADEERSLIARSELRRLKSTLSRMRPVDAQALLLRYAGGCTVAETAAAIGASEYSTASRLARARRELLRRSGYFHQETQ